MNTRIILALVCGLMMGLASGCASPRPAATSVASISNCDIREMFSQVSVPINVSDRTYACPSRQWLHKFRQSFAAMQSTVGAPTYRSSYDCDNLACGLYWLAQVYYANHPDTTRYEAVAIGELWYVRCTDGTGHAVNVAILGDEREIVFIEPASFEFITLTPTEMASIQYIRF